MTDKTTKIVIDPNLTTAAHAYNLSLEAASNSDRDAQAKLADAKAKLAELRRRLGDGDATVTVPALQGAQMSLERAQLLAGGTSRKLETLKRRVVAPPVGVAEVLAEELTSKLYRDVPVTITTDAQFTPGALPHLVIVIPNTPAKSKGGGVVELPKIELILHRRSSIERHHDAERLQEALESLGWQASVDEADEVEVGSPQTIRVRIRAGFEAIPELTDAHPADGWEVGHPFTLATGDASQVITPDGVLTLNWESARLDERTEDGVTTAVYGVRVSGWERGRMRGQLPSLEGIGSPAAHDALAHFAGKPKGLLPEAGRITSVLVEDGVPTWVKSLPDLRAKYVERHGVDATYGGTAVNPVGAAFARVKVVSKAKPEAAEMTIGDDLDADDYATAPDGSLPGDHGYEEQSGTVAQRMAAYTASER